jgi:hypothetical protein
MENNTTAKNIAEEKYPETTNEFKRIMEEQYNIFCKKMLDYGVSNISNGTDLSSDDDIKFSLTGLFFRKNDKIQRLKQLVVLNNKNQVSDESVIDTYQDLTNYSIISQIVKNKKWGK